MPRSLLHTAGDPSYPRERVQHVQVSELFLSRILGLVCVCKAADSVKLRSAGNRDLGKLMPRGKNILK